MQTRALVIIYTGEEVKEDVLATIAAYLEQYGNNVTDAVAFDAQEIGKIMLRESNCVIGNMGKKNPVVQEAQTPEDEAVVFIGTTMKEELGSDYTDKMFVASLIDRIRRAKKYPTKTANREFMNALFILSQEDLKISASLMERYNLNPDKLAIIRETYNFLAKF
jgi:hypothetical protein